MDDIARGTIAALKSVGFEIINLGGNEPHKLIDFIHIIEKYLNKKANIVYEPFHPADMMATHANINKAMKLLNWKPKASIEQGIDLAIGWYLGNKEWVSRIKL